MALDGVGSLSGIGNVAADSANPRSATFIALTGKCGGGWLSRT